MAEEKFEVAKEEAELLPWTKEAADEARQYFTDAQIAASKLSDHLKKYGEPALAKGLVFEFYGCPAGLDHPEGDDAIVGTEVGTRYHQMKVLANVYNGVRQKAAVASAALRMMEMPLQERATSAMLIAYGKEEVKYTQNA